MAKKNNKKNNKNVKNTSKDEIKESKVEEESKTKKEDKEKSKEKKETKEIKEVVKENKKEEPKEESKKEEAKKEVEKDNKSKTNKEKKEHKKAGKLAIIICAIISALLICVIGYTIYIMIRPKFKNTTIELGTKEIKAQDFTTMSFYNNNSKIVTDLSTIDFNKLGDQDIVLSYNNGKNETVKLTIKDTTPPKVEFQNVTKYTGYVLDPNDFIVSKEDLSDMTVESPDKPDTTKYEDHTVKIIVRDSSGNETSKDCTLTICWLKAEATFQAGAKLTGSDFVVNTEADSAKVPQEEINKIDVSKLGDYELKVTYEGKEYTCKVKIVDTQAPNLELNAISVYDDDTRSFNKDSFIKSVSDNSGNVTTTMTSNIDFSKMGTQNITIKAEDPYGNVTEKTTTFNRHKDTTGPKIYGLSDMSIAKNSSPNYNSGVYAKDEKDGNCEVSVDSSGVNTGAAGVYYVKYTSKDKSGNSTTSKRKVSVQHNASDVNALVKDIANSCGNSIQQIHDYVQKNIKYAETYGDGNPVWYGFTNWRGNCYVHALCYQAILQQKGYKTQLIWVNGKTHYWVLIYTNGKWWHSDATPDATHRRLPVLATDAQRKALLKGRDWDRSAWPAC